MIEFLCGDCGKPIKPWLRKNKANCSCEIPKRPTGQIKD